LGYKVKVITAFEPDPSRDEVVFVCSHANDRKSFAGRTERVIRTFLFPSDTSVVCCGDAFKAAESRVRRYPKTAVFSTFPPINSHILAWRLKRRHGLRWIADFRDPLVGSAARARVHSNEDFGRLSAGCGPASARAIFRDADALIANTDTVWDSWQKHFPASAGKMIHIGNGFDREELSTAALTPERDFKLIAHMGSIYTGHPGPPSFAG